MGWGRLLLLGNVGQQFDINEAQDALAETRTDLARLQVEDDSTRKRMARLEHENEELKLYLAAVVRLLTEKGVVSRDELQVIVTAIDGSDGNPDGRYNGKIAPD